MFVLQLKNFDVYKRRLKSNLQYFDNEIGPSPDFFKNQLWPNLILFFWWILKSQIQLTRDPLDQKFIWLNRTSCIEMFGEREDI